MSNGTTEFDALQEELNDEASSWDYEAMKKYYGKNGQKVEVNGVSLYYEKAGAGPHPILLCVGLSGTIDSDYMKFMLPGGFDHEKFTLVALESRGFGNSVPPKRTIFPPDFQVQDAKDGVELMKLLGYEKFSWLGWCAGGNVGIVAAALYPDNIRSLIIWGTAPIVTEKTVEGSKSLTNLDNWSEIMLKPKLISFEKQYIVELFTGYYEYLLWCYEKNNGDSTISYLPKVKCPTLLLDLEMDYHTEKKQIQVTKEKIKNIKVVTVPDGKHAFHLKHPERFRVIVEEYLNTV